MKGFGLGTRRPHHQQLLLLTMIVLVLAGLVGPMRPQTALAGGANGTIVSYPAKCGQAVYPYWPMNFQPSPVEEALHTTWITGTVYATEDFVPKETAYGHLRHFADLTGLGQGDYAMEMAMGYENMTPPTVEQVADMHRFLEAGGTLTWVGEFGENYFVAPWLNGVLADLSGGAIQQNFSEKYVVSSDVLPGYGRDFWIIGHSTEGLENVPFLATASYTITGDLVKPLYKSLEGEVLAAEMPIGANGGMLRVVGDSSQFTTYYADQPTIEAWDRLTSCSTPTVTVQQELPHLALSPVEQTVKEGTDGYAAVRITRTGGLSQVFTETLNIDGPALRSGQATVGSGYQLGDNVLSFAAGETAKVIYFPINNDSTPHATSGFTLLLAQNPGLVVEGKGRASVTVIDDDPVPVPPGCGNNHDGFCSPALVHIGLPMVGAEPLIHPKS